MSWISYKSWLWRNFKKVCRFFLSDFSGSIQNSFDILYAELYVIYKVLLLAKEMGITDFVCYSDSLHCINILNGPPMRFHAYTILIQDIKKLLEQGNVRVNHTLREENQCADFFAKLDASSDVEFLCTLLWWTSKISSKVMRLKFSI